MERKILKIKWRDIPFEDIPECHFDFTTVSREQCKESIWKYRRNQPIEIYIPAEEPLDRWCNQLTYRRVDNYNFFVCSCLVEIGD